MKALFPCYLFSCILVGILSHIHLTFSSSLLSSINFVPSSERYKLQNRFRVFFLCAFFCVCDYSIKPIKQCFYNVFLCIKVYRNFVYFSMFFYIKKATNLWNAALCDVIDDVRSLVSKTCNSSRTSVL